MCVDLAEGAVNWKGKESLENPTMNQHVHTRNSVSENKMYCLSRSFHLEATRAPKRRTFITEQRGGYGPRGERNIIDHGRTLARWIHTEADA